MRKTRETSKVLVNVLDVSILTDEVAAWLKERGKLGEGETIKIDHSIGMVEKDGLHYIINSEGVGSTIPLEKEAVDIEWYAIRVVNGETVAFDMWARSRSNIGYNELIEKTKVREQVTLDKFIRSFGARLEDNFREWENFLLY